MAAFLQDTVTATTEAEKGGTQAKLTLDAVFSTLPELDELARERFESASASSTNFEVANEALCREEDVKLPEAETSSAGDSLRVVCVELASHCTDMASSPQFPSELQGNLTFGATDPPMVDTGTNNMFKVSIYPSLSFKEEQLHQTSGGCLENGGSAHSECHENNIPMQANDGGDAPAPMCKTDVKLLLPEAEASSAGDSPRVVCVELASHCTGMACSPQFPSELQGNLTFGATDPPIVDTVTNNMFKVSIDPSLSLKEEQLHQTSGGCLENGGSVHSECHENNISMQENDGGDAPAPMCKTDVKLLLPEAEASSAEDSLRVVCVELASHCTGMASSPQFPSELQGNLALGATDPPMVDTVTNNMFKVSIYPSLSLKEEQLHQTSGGCLENGGSGHSECHENNILMQAIDGGDTPMCKTDAGDDDNPLCGNGHTARVNLSLQINDYKMGEYRILDCKPPSAMKYSSELGSDKEDDDDGKGDVDGGDGDEEEEAEGSDNNDDEEVDDSDEAQDSDSSSSTSSLSFLSSSSSDDDDEVIVHRSLLNRTGSQKGLALEVESECEEGELKEPPSQRKESAMNESSEDEGGSRKPVRSKNEMKELPFVPKVSVTLEPHHTTVPAGFVSSVVGMSLIVEGIEGQQALTEGSILWLTDWRVPLGIVDELFGPVKKPFYVVRYNDATEMPECAKEGSQVSYVRDFADFVLNKPDLYAKGYDNSADNDEELSDSEVYFSDDEKEAEYNRSKFRMKRGNSESSVPDVENRRHQEKGRAQGKRFNKDNQNWRSRGENARNSQSNNEKDFSGRPPRHQNPRFQHHRGEREPPFRMRGEPTQSFNERSELRLENRSPIREVQSQQSLGVGQPKSPAPPRQAASTSDWAAAKQQQVQPAKANQFQSSAQESQLVIMNQIHSSTHSTSRQTQPPSQINQQHSFTQLASQQTQPLQMNQPHGFMQSPLQQAQPLTLHQPHNLMQSTGQMNQPQSTFPQVQQWQMNQPHNSAPMASPQLPGMQHSQMSMYNHGVVAGQIPQVAVSGYGIPVTSKVPLQSGMDTAQGLLPLYQSPIYQQVPSMNHFPSASPQFSGQSLQVSPNMGMPMGNQLQAVHAADGYPMGVQSAAFAAPVLGIPAGPASIPFNYPSQGIYNQGFTPEGTPAFANQGPPSAFGVPEQARGMLQPLAGTSSGSWQHQHSPQDSSGPQQQQQLHHQRPPFSNQRKGGSYRGRRF